MASTAGRTPGDAGVAILYGPLQSDQYDDTLWHTTPRIVKPISGASMRIPDNHGFSRRSKTIKSAWAAALTVIGVLALSTTAITAANASSIVASTCQYQSEGIYTCEWLVSSQVYVPDIGRNDTQLSAQVDMFGGTVNQQIIQVQLQSRACLYGCAVLTARESPIPVVGGTGTLTAGLQNVLCNSYEYRSVFEWKYWLVSQKVWVTGWSYGYWYVTSNIDCSSGVGM